MDNDISKLDPFLMDEHFCVSGGHDIGLAGRRFIKPALPNAANSIARHGRDEGKKNVFE